MGSSGNEVGITIPKDVTVATIDDGTIGSEDRILIGRIKGRRGNAINVMTEEAISSQMSRMPMIPRETVTGEERMSARNVETRTSGEPFDVAKVGKIGSSLLRDVTLNGESNLRSTKNDHVVDTS